MSLSMLHDTSTCAGGVLMKADRSESMLAPLALMAAVETRTFPPAVTSPELPFRCRRLVSELTRTCASLKACLLTSKVIATAEKGEARSDPQAQSARAQAARYSRFIRARPSASARPAPPPSG